MKRIIDAGHYYLAKGPTIWSVIGWQIGKQIARTDDASLLFIDDVHSLEMMHPEEKEAGLVYDYDPQYDLLIYETSVFPEAMLVLENLKCLSKKKKAKMRRNGQWYCSGFPLTKSNGDPLCGLLDAGLSLSKFNLGYQTGVNVLPYFYEPQQVQVLRLVKKAIPEFVLQVILFNEKGEFWEMPQ